MIARFHVDGFEPRQVAGLDADWFSLFTFAKTFTSGITGHATTVFMSAGAEEGSRSYVATERITGRTDDGREGSVTVQHGGLESDPGTWFGISFRAPGPAASRAGPARPVSSTTGSGRTSRTRWTLNLGLHARAHRQSYPRRPGRCRSAEVDHGLAPSGNSRRRVSTVM